MYAKPAFLVAFALALGLAMGCQSVSPPPKLNVVATSVAQAPASIVPVVTLPTATSTAVSRAPSSTATMEPTNNGPLSIVEDCMDACHKPSPNDILGNGAPAQPADHVGRTTCLECHSAPKDPLPETHLGRMDASCTVCHK